MHVFVVAGHRSPQVSFHEEDWVPTPTAAPFGASDYGFIWQHVAQRRAPQIRFTDGDTPQLSTPVHVTGAQYIPQFRRRRR